MDDLITLQPVVVSKQKMPALGTDIAAKLLDTYSAGQAYVVVQNLAQVLQAAAEQLKERAINDIAGVREQEILGAKVEYRKKPSAWVYDKDDSTLSALEEEYAMAKERLDNHRLFLKQAAISGKKQVVDENTGEIVKTPTEEPQGYTIAVTFK